jgi:asparagine synthase (glutamine-hydrolysing)
MCGICGLAGRDNEPLVRRMTELLVHRGPDGGAVRAFPSRDSRLPATLGHRRLSIIDPTERGAQPMQFGDGRYWITYNGELYNFRALRAELERDGFTFRTECDTEVVLAMYARHGADMLPRLNGMYAFAIWDTERDELFLARDRLGVKPLYYAEHDGTLVFASEIKALLPALPPIRLNHAAVPDYLTFLWVPDPDTMFRDIFRLPPGHYARFGRDGLSIHEWWDLRFAPEERPEGDWAWDTRAAIRAAVQRQMVSDVPLGAFLSGGLDSSAIVAEMAGAAGEVSAYTIGLTREDLAYDIVGDDVRYAREVARAFRVDYHERVLRADVAALLPTLIWHLDEPVADPAVISAYLVCAAARERLKVILSGMGGDEVFAGYPRHLAARLGRVLDSLPASARAYARRAVESHVTVGGPGPLRRHRRNLLKFVGALEEGTQERYLTHCSYYRPGELRALLSTELAAATAGHDPFARHRGYFDRVSDEHWLNQLLYVDLKTFLPCLNLAYTDKMSMAASTEVRVPLLDDEVVGLAARVPASLKLNGTKRKYVFRKAMEGVVPDSVIRRPKAGFTAPARAWLAGPLRPLVDELLSTQAVRRRGLFAPAEVRRLIEANTRGEADNALRIWALLTLELWQRTFVDGDGREATPLSAALTRTGAIPNGARADGRAATGRAAGRRDRASG